MAEKDATIPHDVTSGEGTLAGGPLPDALARRAPGGATAGTGSSTDSIPHVQPPPGYAPCDTIPHVAATAPGGGTESSPPPTTPPSGAILNLAPGSRLGPYEIRGELGRGAMGVVYRAYHRSLKRECALKTLTTRIVGEEAVEQFLKEAQAAARLGKHPNIVQIFDGGLAGTIPYFAMEFVHGETIDHRVRERGPIPEAELLEVGRKIALALDHAHRCGIVHRDIKPANVIMNKNGEPEILDFGIAQDLGPEGGGGGGDEGSLAGTPAFMSPEQADPDNGRADRRSDVYSLGATLYFAASGARPIDGQSVPELIYNLLTKEPPPLKSKAPDVSQDLDAVVLRALEKQPDNRFQTALELADDLSRLAAGEPTRTRPLGFLQRVHRRLRKHAALATLATLFAVTAVGAASYFIWRRSETVSLWEDLSRQATRSAASEVRSLLGAAVPRLNECREMARSGLMPVDDPEALERHLVVRLRWDPRLAWISYSDERGRFTGAFRRDDGAIGINRSWIDPSGTGHLREHVVATDWKTTPLRSSDAWEYDPRKRPFYALAVAAPDGKAVWTEPYPWWAGEGYGITSAMALRDAGEGRVRGVFTADFRLDRISRFLSGIEIARTGRVVLLDRGGRAIAGALVGGGGPEARDEALEGARRSAPRPVKTIPPGSTDAFVSHRGRDDEADSGRQFAVFGAFEAAEGLELVSAILLPLEDFEVDLKRRASSLGSVAIVVFGGALLLVIVRAVWKRKALLAQVARKRPRR